MLAFLAALVYSSGSSESNDAQNNEEMIMDAKWATKKFGSSAPLTVRSRAKWGGR